MEDVQFKFEDENTFELGESNQSNDEIKLSRGKQKLKIKRTKSKSTRIPKFNAPSQHNVQPSHHNVSSFNDKTFEAFSNPTKRMPQVVEPELEEEESEASFDRNMGNGSHHSEDMQSDPGFSPEEPDFSEAVPSSGFSCVDEEKQDILFKFHRLEKKGIKIGKKFNMFSDIREMRLEYNKIKKDAEMNGSVKFSRKMLMAFVSASEFLNKRYDPFSVELNGWSETVMENVNEGDYDNVFERLHEKYAGKVNTPPEMELMLSLAGSAVMFHMTSSMFKNVPQIGELAKNNPDIQKAMKSMADSLMKSQVQPEPKQAEEQFDQSGQREMRGPSMDLSSFGNILPPPMPSREIPREVPQQTIREPVQSDEESIFSSEQSGISVKQVSVAYSEGGTRKGRKPKIIATKENTIDI
jgi:hypothetical protein